jgi:choline transport protein
MGVMMHKRLTTPDSKIPWGPFRMGPRTGMVVTIIALLYSVFGAFWSMWPSFVNPTPEEMNWCVVVYGGALVFCVLFWFTYGRKTYTGPVLEI